MASTAGSTGSTASSLFTPSTTWNELGVRAEAWGAERTLRWAETSFSPRLTLATGFGAEGCVIIDLVARMGLAVDIFTLDTGVLFPETYDLWKRLEERYGITIKGIRPAQTLEEQAQTYGDKLWERQPEKCCALRKVAPLGPALKGYDAWVTAIRRDQTEQPRLGPPDRVGRQERARQGEPARPLVEGRGLGLHPRVGRPLQRAPRQGLPEHLLPHLHQPGEGRRGRPRRPVARQREDGVRAARDSADARPGGRRCGRRHSVRRSGAPIPAASETRA